MTLRRMPPTKIMTPMTHPLCFNPAMTAVSIGSADAFSEEVNLEPSLDTDVTSLYFARCVDQSLPQQLPRGHAKPLGDALEYGEGTALPPASLQHCHVVLRYPGPLFFIQTGQGSRSLDEVV